MTYKNSEACQCCSRPVKRSGTGAKNGDTGKIDHCHATGKVRGILCHHCKVALGHLGDKPNLAVAYLEARQ